MKNLQVIILCGGEGKRFFPLTTSKCLFSFLGQPLIEHLLNLAQSVHPEKILVTTSPANQAPIAKIIKEKKFNGLTVLQKEPRGMADSLLSAASLLESSPLLVLNGDDYFDETVLTGVVAKGNRIRQLVLAGYETQSYFPGGYFVLKEDRVVQIVEKPQEGQEPSRFVRLVVDYLPDALQFLKILQKTPNLDDNQYETTLNQVIKNQKGAEFIHYSGPWGHLKYPWHVLEMMFLFLEKIKPLKAPDVYLSPKATIEGPVVLESGVKVFEGAKIKGPAWIGEGTIIGNNALVRESMLGHHCVIGYSTEIARSYINNHCWFHANYVGDSVLDENVSFGSGTVAANLRLDEAEVIVKKEKEKIKTGRDKLGALVGKNVRIGVNTSLMPGVLVGQNSLVGAGLVLNQNLPANSFCHSQTKLVVVKSQQLLDPHKRAAFRQKI